MTMHRLLWSVVVLMLGKREGGDKIYIKTLPK